MTEQTERADVETLAWALAIVQRMGNEKTARAELPLWQDFAESLMNAPAFEDWLAARESAAEARGAQAVLAAVEALVPDFEADYGIQSSPVARIKALVAAARGVEGGV